jgi:hypothetical protein
MGHFAETSIGIFENKGSENSRNAKSQNFIWIGARSGPAVMWGDERSCARDQRARVGYRPGAFMGVRAPSRS